MLPESLDIEKDQKPFSYIGNWPINSNKELIIELSLERLEIIVSKMESGEVSLEKSLVLFEEGMILIKECQGD